MLDKAIQNESYHNRLVWPILHAVSQNVVGDLVAIFHERVDAFVVRLDLDDLSLSPDVWMDSAV